MPSFVASRTSAITLNLSSSRRFSVAAFALRSVAFMT